MAKSNINENLDSQMESVLENDYTTVHKVYTSFSVSLVWKVSISLTAW